MTNADNSMIESALAAQADAVVSLINQIHDAQDAQLTSDLAAAFGMDEQLDMQMSEFSSMAARRDPAGCGWKSRIFPTACHIATCIIARIFSMPSCPRPI